MDDYLQWLINHGRARHELTDVYVKNHNGEVSTEKVMAWVISNTPEDWKKYCKETGTPHEQNIVIAFE